MSSETFSICVISVCDSWFYCMSYCTNCCYS